MWQLDASFTCNMARVLAANRAFAVVESLSVSILICCPVCSRLLPRGSPPALLVTSHLGSRETKPVVRPTDSSAMVQLHNLLGVLCISVGVSCLIELAQWLIIYRCGVVTACQPADPAKDEIV